MKKYCCCTGHRPNGFPFDYFKDEEKRNAYLTALQSKIGLAIEQGATQFISGMSLGVDLDFAEIILKLKAKFPITLECAMPYPDYFVRWSFEDEKRNYEILKSADKVTLVSDRYFNGCLFKRNRYMVDKSDLVIAVFNGEKKGGTFYTLSYAEKQGKHIQIIDLREL